MRDIKTPILEKAADRLRKGASFQELRAGADAFRQQNPWVEDSALFYALSHHREELINVAWWEWPGPIRYWAPPSSHPAFICTPHNLSEIAQCHGLSD